MFKQTIVNIIKYPLWASLFLRLSLNLHNVAYQAAGMISPVLEPDGLHPKHRIMKYHDWFSSRLDRNWDVLDIGCGNGALAFDMKLFCRSVTGIDISQKNVDMAKKNFSREGIDYICADALDYRFERRFQAIILSNVLEHIDRRVEFLKMIYENQDKEKPPVLLLRVPMITRDWITLYKKEKGIEWRLDSTHFTEYTLEQVLSEMDQAGLTVETYEIKFGEFYGVVKKNKTAHGAILC